MAAMALQRLQQWHASVENPHWQDRGRTRGHTTHSADARELYNPLMFSIAASHSMMYTYVDINGGCPTCGEIASCSVTAAPVVPWGDTKEATDADKFHSYRVQGQTS